MTPPDRVLLLFLDGVGIGPADPAVNPFLNARIPTLRHLMGGALPTLDAAEVDGAGGHSFPVDATLGVDGTPQSGTGQAALLTGESTAELFGRHFGPWTPVALRPLVENHNVLKRVREAGRAVAFANAYPRGWPGARGGRRTAGPPLAARGAGLLTRHEEALASGDAVSSEIVNDGWRRHLGHTTLPEVTAVEAGANLARIANRHDLTLYAHYATDTAGHRGRMEGAIAALERVDAFLEGVTAYLDSGALLMLVSDHGNLEDVRVGHTRNPSLGVAAGAGAEQAAALRDLRHVASFLVDSLVTPSV